MDETPRLAQTARPICCNVIWVLWHFKVVDNYRHSICKASVHVAKDRDKDTDGQLLRVLCSEKETSHPQKSAQGTELWTSGL
jgi:hypothetical protein